MEVQPNGLSTPDDYKALENQDKPSLIYFGRRDKDEGARALRKVAFGFSDIKTYISTNSDVSRAAEAKDLSLMLLTNFE